MEVPGRDEQAVVDEHERVVGRRVELGRDRVLDVVEQVARRAVHLRRAAQRVRVLHLVAPAVRLDDRRAVEQAQHVARRRALTAQRPQLVHLRDERVARALQRLERERARAVGGLRQPERANERERACAAMNCVPLISDSPSFATSRTGSSPAARERVGAVEQLAVEPRLPFADERQREVRERREVAGGADRPARRDVRQHAAVQAVEQQLDRLDARAGVALRERVRAQEHRGAHDLDRGTARRRRRRASAAAGAAAPRSAPPGSASTRTARSRCSRRRCARPRRGPRARRPRAPRCIRSCALAESGAASTPFTATAQTSASERSSPVSARVADTSGHRSPVSDPVFNVPRELETAVAGARLRPLAAPATSAGSSPPSPRASSATRSTTSRSCGSPSTRRAPRA